MAPNVPRAALCAAIVFSSITTYGFQAPGASGVSVVPRARTQIVAHIEAAPPAELRIDSQLVEIPVHVTMRDGTPVTNLEKGNFRVFEDGLEQKISYFTQDDAPLSIGMLFDSSGSMHNKIQKSSEAAATFFKTANVQDEFFLVEFSERPKLTVPFTPDSDEVYKRIRRIKPFGRTSLLDAIHMALQEMKKARNTRKALVLVSDGGDNRSRYTASEIKEAVLESDVQLYAMGIFDRDGKKLPIEEQNGPELLKKLAEQTGGRHYPVDNLEDLDSISREISTDLRNEYLIGYSPSNPVRDGKHRQIRVQVAPPSDLPELRIYHRHGYNAPTQ